MSPLAVTNSEDSLNELGSSSCNTRRIARALLVATSWSTTTPPLPDDELLFHGTIVAGTRTIFRWDPQSWSFSKSLGFSVDELIGTVRLRPRKGRSRNKTTAFISIKKLFNACTENNALILPLAPDVSIKDEEAAERSIAINEDSGGGFLVRINWVLRCKSEILVKIRRGYDFGARIEVKWEKWDGFFMGGEIGVIVPPGVTIVLPVEQIINRETENDTTHNPEKKKRKRKKWICYRFDFVSFSPNWNTACEAEDMVMEFVLFLVGLCLYSSTWKKKKRDALLILGQLYIWIFFIFSFPLHNNNNINNNNNGNINLNIIEFIPSTNIILFILFF